MTGVTLDKLLNLSVPLFPPIKYGINSTHSIHCGLKILIMWCLAIQGLIPFPGTSGFSWGSMEISTDEV